MSWSEKKTDALGNEYVQHYDDVGNKIGRTETKAGAFGDRYQQHYEEDGTRSGTSRSDSGALRGQYEQHYRENGTKDGWTEEKKGAFGARYDQHFKRDGTERGWSEQRKGAFGDPYEQQYSQDGSKSRSRRSRGSGFGPAPILRGGGGGSASALGGIAIIVAFIFAAGPADLWLLTTDPAEYNRIVKQRRDAELAESEKRASHLVTQHEIENRAQVAATVPSGNMNPAQYAITHSFVPYEQPRTYSAPGQPGIGWQVPIHAGPTTLSRKLGELPYRATVLSQGAVRGPDGRTWEAISQPDGTIGFVLQSEMRESTGALPNDTFAPPPRAYADDPNMPFCSGDYEVRVSRNREILCNDPEAARLQHMLIEVLERRVVLEGERRRQLIFSQMASSAASIGICGSFQKNARECVIDDLQGLVEFNENRIAENMAER